MKDKKKISEIWKRQMRVNKKWATLLLALLILAGFLFYQACGVPIQKSFGVLDQDILIEVPASELPNDTLYITYNRMYYQRGQMTLIVPSIEIFTPVGESTEPDGLMQMPGLYEFAQLPFEELANTSIAGHRDIYDMVFYSLDKVREGDYLYLLHEGIVYRYLYIDTTIITPDDWSLIYPQGFNCLTLTTCDPIGTTTNRLVVRAELIDIQEFDESYQFIETSEVNQ